MSKTICALTYWAMAAVFGWQLAEVGATPLEAGVLILNGFGFWVVGMLYGKAGVKK